MSIHKKVENSTAKPHVLIVDDEPANLMALEKVLQSCNVTVTKAQSGNEALGKLFEHEYACVLLDVMMHPMDGFEVLRLIRNDDSFKYLPIIIVTAHSRETKELIHGYELGASDYLFKPLENIVVQKKVSFFVELYRKTKMNEALMDELKRSNHELEQFAYIVAHDLQAPLRHLISFVDLLNSNKSSPEDNSKWLKFINESAFRMNKLVEGLLEYARIGKTDANIKEVQIDTIITDILKTLAITVNEAHAEIHVTKMPTVHAVEVNMIQLFQNLINNAIKFRHKGTAPSIEISYVEDPEKWTFKVKDNGIGIDPKMSEKVFQIFQRLHSSSEYPGTGIGLSVCKKIVEFHGGKIWIEPSESHGTTVCFTISKHLESNARKADA